MRSRALALAVLAALGCIFHTTAGASLSLSLKQTLSGADVKGTPVKISISTNRTLAVQFEAPYYPTKENRVHLFFANGDDRRITELQFTPSGMTTRMYWAPHNLLREFPAGSPPRGSHYTVKVDDTRHTWSGSAEIESAFLPPRISLYNAAAVHPASSEDGQLQYDCLYSITNYGIAIPDLMVLARYIGVGPRFFFDQSSYSEEWKRA